MWSDVIVLFERLIDDGLFLPCCCKPFRVEYFTTQCSVEAFIVTVRPKVAPLERFLDVLARRAARLDINRLDTDFGQQVFEGI